MLAKNVNTMLKFHFIQLLSPSGCTARNMLPPTVNRNCIATNVTPTMLKVLMLQVRVKSSITILKVVVMSLSFSLKYTKKRVLYLKKRLRFTGFASH